MPVARLAVRFDFAADHLDETRAKRKGRHAELTVALDDAAARHHVEEVRDVRADFLVGREETEVGVDRGGKRVVVARADVHVAADARGFAAHDEAEFRVDLESDETVDDVHARAFERFGPVDVALFVKARLEFDDGRHLLAAAARLDEALDDGRIAAAAVKRLLDRHHLRIARSAVDEGEHPGELFIGVEEEHVAFAQRREEIVFRIEDFGRSHAIGHVLQARAVDEAQIHEFREGERAAHLVNLAGLHVDVVEQEVLQTNWHAALEFETHGRAEAALFDVVAHGFEKVVGFVLFNFSVGVARDAEEPVGGHAEAREESAEALADQVFREDHLHVLVGGLEGEVGRGFVEILREEEEALNVVRALQTRVAHVLLVRFRNELDQEVEARVRNPREGMARVDDLGREDRIDVLLKPGLELLALLAAERRELRDDDTLFAQGGLQGLEPEILGTVDEGRHLLTDDRELTARRNSVGARGGDARLFLTEDVGDANHEEFVEVVPENREELHALEKRHAGVFGFGEHLLVEVDPVDFPVEIVLRVVEVDRRFDGGLLALLHAARTVRLGGLGRFGAVESGSRGFDGGDRFIVFHFFLPCEERVGVRTKSPFSQFRTVL